MPDPLNSPTTPSVDQTLDSFIHKTEESITHCLHDCEDFVRKSPTKAMLGAVAAGYLLRNLPLKSILITKIRILAALAPPALVLYGAAKVMEMLQDQQGSQGGNGQQPPQQSQAQQPEGQKQA